MSTPRPLAPRRVATNKPTAMTRNIVGSAPSFTIVAVRESVAIHDIGTKCVLGPVLRRVRHTPGINGVRTGKKDGVRIGDPSTMLNNVPPNHVVLPHTGDPGGRNWSAFGEDMPDYCVAWEKPGGGRHHTYFYQRPVPGSKLVETDAKAREEFLAWASGIAGKPHDIDVFQLRRALEFRRHPLPEKAKRNAAAAKMLVSIDRQLAVFAPTQPEPVSAPPAVPAVDPRDLEMAKLKAEIAALVAAMNGPKVEVTMTPAEPAPEPAADGGDDEFDFESEDEEPAETKPAKVLS